MARKLEIPLRQANDMFWVDKFKAKSYRAYHVVYSAERGEYLAENFEYGEFGMPRTEAEALDLAILFNDRYNKAVRIWECRHDEVKSG